MDYNRIKEKYHEKFRKNINHNKPYFEQLLERAWKEYNNHPIFFVQTNRIEGKITLQDREEIKALNELIKLYQSKVTVKEIEYSSC
jgi:hypothetical protein